MLSSYNCDAIMHKAYGLLLRFGLLIKAYLRRSGSVGCPDRTGGYRLGLCDIYIRAIISWLMKLLLTNRGGEEEQAQHPVVMLILSNCCARAATPSGRAKYVVLLWRFSEREHHRN